MIVEKNEASEVVAEIEFDKPNITYAENGHSGPGYYAHEKEYPGDGSVFLGDLQNQLKGDIIKGSYHRSTSLYAVDIDYVWDGVIYIQRPNSCDHTLQIVAHSVEDAIAKAKQEGGEFVRDDNDRDCKAIVIRKVEEKIQIDYIALQ